jgi:hypothetical protein
MRKSVKRQGLVVGVIGVICLTAGGIALADNESESARLQTALESDNAGAPGGRLLSAMGIDPATAKPGARTASGFQLRVASSPEGKSCIFDAHGSGSCAAKEDIAIGHSFGAVFCPPHEQADLIRVQGQVPADVESVKLTLESGKTVDAVPVNGTFVFELTQANARVDHLASVAWSSASGAVDLPVRLPERAYEVACLKAPQEG